MTKMLPERSWQCPHCNCNAFVGEQQAIYYVWKKNNKVRAESSGDYQLLTFATTCPSPSCNRLSLRVSLKCFVERGMTVGSWQNKEKWSLLPESMAKPFPDYIPEPIRKDYTEACLIKDLSPNASATLARRCLQGMVRNFHDVERSTLKEEFDKIKDKEPSDVWRAIHEVRKIGAIGAHMDDDVNIMVDVVPDEAEKLIWLIEFLLKKWYVDTHETDEELKKFQGMSAKKDTKKQKASAAKKK